MKIILLKDVGGVGRKYEVKNIGDGYATNLLIPKGLAIVATDSAIRKLDTEKAREEGERKVRNELLLKNIIELEGVTIIINEKANEKGHLFAAVHKAEIIPAIEKQTRLQIDADHIVLEKPIKEVGVHEINLKIGEKKITFNLEIKAI